ncbi:FAD-dependent oxidoreductase [Nakamurella leprariae]|uniref:FAD-dependent oxidoreductase n=1 Tax=Nakamurella leprariae TaxID=2803911 RepID=A0A939C3A3_9ACTN|nr:FAD-dependent oxidoreductase [Nakamurella leprariae]MBM9468897.1 FAD-dependent oxidoreductase [Nakamurella leprariae]
MSRGQWLPGRDAAAVRHPGTPGRLRDDREHSVVVVGGGVAGLAAATALAERDVAVTVVEAQDRLGGRVRAWPASQRPDGATGTPTSMSRGFHAFFRQYYNLRGLLRRTDPALERLRPLADYPLVSRAGYQDSFARIPRTPPLNLMAFVLASRTFTLRDLRRIDTDAAGELLDVEFPRTFTDHDGESAAAFLDRMRFPPAARHLALEVFARSFFADPAEFSAGELIGMFHTYFLGSAEGLLFDVPDDDYDTTLWAPLGAYLTDRGAGIRTGTAVTAVRSGADGVVVDTAAGPLHADAVVVATDRAATQRLLGAPDALRADQEWRRHLLSGRSAPPFAVWRLWLDRPAHADRPPFLGTAEYGCVDNISLVDRFEDGAASWAQRTGGSVVELHAYALPAQADHDAVRAEMLAVLAELYPELAGAHAVADSYLVEDDCPLVGTEPWASRPGVVTPDPRVVLAGDGIRCEFPVALMERAATTGFQAANRLLAGWQLAGHDLWTVPLGARTWLARHAGRAAARRTGSPAAAAPVRG